MPRWFLLGKLLTKCPGRYNLESGQLINKPEEEKKKKKIVEESREWSQVERMFVCMDLERIGAVMPRFWLQRVECVDTTAKKKFFQATYCT